MTILQGKDKIKDYKDSNTTSGRTITRSFCADCGSTLFTHPSKVMTEAQKKHGKGNDFVMIAAGSMDSPTANDWGESHPNPHLNRIKQHRIDYDMCDDMQRREKRTKQNPSGVG